MRDPKGMFTKAGYRKYMAALTNIQEDIFYITNHADDLLLDDEILTSLYAAEEGARELEKREDSDSYEYEKDEE